LAEVSLTARVWPFVIVLLVAHAPPLTEICGLPLAPVTDTLAVPVSPTIVMALDVESVFSATSVRSANVNASGVVSFPNVVTAHVSLTLPTVIVAVNPVLQAALEVRRTARVWPFVMLPEVTHAPPAIDICGEPEPLTETGVVVLVPPIAMLFDVISVLRATSV
jgi:hypothetical protein